MIAFAGLAVTAPGAQAATIATEGDALVLRAAPGEENNVYLDGSSGPPGRLRLTDVNPITSIPSSCEERDETTIDCEVPGRVRIELADGPDRFEVGSAYVWHHPVEVDGGTGEDVLRGDTDDGRRETLRGGAGKDRIDGFGGDDHLEGGPDDDLLNGNSGNDVVLGQDGDDSVAGDDQGDPGADLVDGGPGSDAMQEYVDYEDDVHPAADVSLDGQANDGRPGEGDNVVSVERYTALVSGRFVLTDGAEVWRVLSDMNSGASVVLAGGGDDTLTGDNAVETFDGGAGADRLEGGKNHDTLIGGPGRDLIFGDETSDTCDSSSFESCLRYGNDVIDSRDGEQDQVDCGAGTDRVTADALDVVAANCETLDRGMSAGGAGGGTGPGGTPPGTGPGGTPPGTAPGGTRPGTTPGGGPAGPPPSSDPGTAASRFAIAVQPRLATALKRGVTVTLTGARPGKAKIVAKLRGRTVASGKVTVPRTGSAKVRLRFSKAAARKLRRAKSVKLSISGAGIRTTLRVGR